MGPTKGIDGKNAIKRDPLGIDGPGFEPLRSAPPAQGPVDGCHHRGQPGAVEVLLQGQALAMGQIGPQHLLGPVIETHDPLVAVQNEDRLPGNLFREIRGVSRRNFFSHDLPP